MSQQYPRDEFDDLPDEAPVGVHRKPKSPWQSVLPFLVVLLVVPLLAWGATTLIKGRGSDTAGAQSPPGQTQSQEQAQSDPDPIPPAEEDGPSGAPDNPGDEGTGEGEEEQPDVEVIPVDYEASVAVLNGSGIAGLAGRLTETLQTAGFANAWAGNAADTVTPENTVYYRDASMRSTAEAVGAATGVTTFVENASAVGESAIAVLLRTEP